MDKKRKIYFFNIEEHSGSNYGIVQHRFDAVTQKDEANDFHRRHHGGIASGGFICEDGEVCYFNWFDLNG